MDLFIKKVLSKDAFEGCYYYQLDNKYYLVFTYNDKGELQGKVAYNCDDLQCDYDWDWYMPEKDGEVLDTEICDCRFYSPKELYDEFIRIYEQVKDI